MLAIRLDSELEAALDQLAKVRGSNRSALAREAIVRYLEDCEDLEVAQEALAATRSTTPLKDLRRDLGLDR